MLIVQNEKIEKNIELSLFKLKSFTKSQNNNLQLAFKKLVLGSDTALIVQAKMNNLRKTAKGK
jgi:hypothetical protein